MPCRVVTCQSAIGDLLAEVREEQQLLSRPPHLVAFLANSDPGAKQYAEWTEKTFKEHGFRYTLATVRREEIESAILAANDDAAVDGIIIYYPVFANQQDQYLRQLVDVSKDVEGLSHRYLFNMYENIRFLDPPACTKKCILPCTPLGIIKILEHLRIYDTALPEGNRLFGRTIGVINRSEVVGRPLAALMANDGASVYSVDLTGIQKFTRGPSLDKPRHEVKDLPADTPEGSLQHILPQCEVVISGVPGDYKVDLGLVRDGAVCINFSTQRNFAPEVKEKASIYVPSTGKATIAILMRNLLRLVKNASS